MRTNALAGKRNWLPDMDLNHDKQIQSLLCYRYTIGQTSSPKVRFLPMESRLLHAGIYGFCGPVSTRVSLSCCHA
jgi:hypothetical protein